jgi:mannose-6-phosphate isomerase-like protein (cupin superfamily)
MGEGVIFQSRPLYATSRPLVSEPSHRGPLNAAHTAGVLVSAPTDPYETRLNILHEALELIDIGQLVDDCKFPWYNQTLCKVNDSVVRLGVVQGEYHWHKHDNDDEFFYCVSGQFLIDLEDRTIALNPRQGVVVPRGVRHRPRAPERTVILMVETASIIPTGD